MNNEFGGSGMVLSMELLEPKTNADRNCALHHATLSSQKQE